jgi:hypothetical protein
MVMLNGHAKLTKIFISLYFIDKVFFLTSQNYFIDKVTYFLQNDKKKSEIKLYSMIVVLDWA